MKEKKLKLLSEETTAMYCIYKTFSCSHYYCIKKNLSLFPVYIQKSLHNQTISHSHIPMITYIFDCLHQSSDTSNFLSTSLLLFFSLNY